MTNNSSPPEFEPLTRDFTLKSLAITASILVVMAIIGNYFIPKNVISIFWNLEDLLLAIGLAIVVCLMSGLLYYVCPHYRTSTQSYVMLIKPLLWIDLIWVGILPGISEELLFRGVILPVIGVNLIGVLLSSLVFGSLHLPTFQDWPYAVWVGIVGFLLGYTVMIRGNLLIPIVAHILINWTYGVIWKIKSSQKI